jgi:hypothetical protein
MGAQGGGVYFLNLPDNPHAKPQSRQDFFFPASFFSFFAPPRLCVRLFFVKLFFDRTKRPYLYF